MKCNCNYYFRAWCPDRTLMESKKYITQSLGAQFADPVIFNMEAMVFESRPRTPLVNFLSMGSDPTVEIETLARKLRIPCQSISMGQAQEIHARKLIDAFVVQVNPLIHNTGYITGKYPPNLRKSFFYIRK